MKISRPLPPLLVGSSGIRSSGKDHSGPERVSSEHVVVEASRSLVA